MVPQSIRMRRINDSEQLNREKYEGYIGVRKDLNQTLGTNLG